MTELFLYLYPLIYILVIFAGCKVSKKNEFSTVFWDRSQAQMIQAVACMGVVMHHLTQRITNYGSMYRGPVTLFDAIGFLFTSLFFFFSGYGLIISLRTKENYLNGFLWHRMTVILAPFWIANIISVVICICYQKIPMSINEIITCILGIELIDGNGWYIIEITLLYLLFYFCFKYIRNRNVALILLSIACLLPIKLGLYNGHNEEGLVQYWFKGEWWYNSTIIFIMGLWVAHFKERITPFLQKHYKWLMATSPILLVVTFLIAEYARHAYGYYLPTPIEQRISNELITLIAQGLLCIVFTWFVLLINMKIAIGNVCLRVVSTRSLEIFLLHGIILDRVFDYTKINAALLYPLIFATAICAATVLGFVDKKIVAFVVKKTNEARVHLSEYEQGQIKAAKARKIKKICLLVIGIVGIIFVLWKGYVSWIRPKYECKKEMTLLEQAQVLDEVNFGRYETDRLLPGAEHLQWIVLQKTDDALLLITKEGIAGNVYHWKHKPISWSGSTLCHFLNEELYEDLFSKEEQKMILNHPKTGDKISLLSPEEADALFSDDKSRQISITDAAKISGTNINQGSKDNYWDMVGYRSSWWWLRGDETAKVVAPIVTVDGEILPDRKFVNKPNGAVRPVIWVAIE